MDAKEVQLTSRASLSTDEEATPDFLREKGRKGRSEREGVSGSGQTSFAENGKRDLNPRTLLVREGKGKPAPAASILDLLTLREDSSRPSSRVPCDCKELSLHASASTLTRREREAVLYPNRGALIAWVNMDPL